MRAAHPRAARLLVAVVVVGLAGCAMRVDPPVGVHEPTTVYLADYGYHASVLLPRDDGMLSEFAFGQWEWFALNHCEWYHALGIALLPSPGTLGTRIVAPPRDETAVTRPATGPRPCGVCGQCPADAQHARNEFAAALWAQEVFALRVERSRAAALRDRLQAEYDAARETEVYNPQVRLTLVRTKKVYWHHQNCNSVVGVWLEALGCRVTGGRSFAVFEVFAPARSDPTP